MKRSTRRGYYLHILAIFASFSLGAGTALAVDESGMTAGASQICDSVVGQRATSGLQTAVSGSDNYYRNAFTPPPQLSQIANTPCMSKELQRINSQFMNMLRPTGLGAVASAFGGGSPVSSIMNNSFKGDVTNFNSAASIIPQMLNFQSMASNVLGGLLSSLGLGDAFSGQMCGLMMDMVLKYIQCENPIKFPNLSNLFGNLNLNMPGGCAGQALRTGMNFAQKLQDQQPMSQMREMPEMRTFDGTAFRRQ